MTDAPLISVVIPSYQRPDALRRCLHALSSQDMPRRHYEVIVVDDGSDPPLLIDDDLIRQGLDLTVARQANRGPAAARNHGARLARAKWLAFTDDDCAPEASWLTTLLRKLEENPSAQIGGQTSNALTGNVYAQASQDLVAFLYDYFPEAVRLRPFFASNNLAMQRDRFFELCGFDESFPFAAAEDRDFSERWTRAGGSLLYEPSAMVAHFHALTLTGLALQHHTYGRGALRLVRARVARGERRSGPEPLRFYWQMLCYPFKKHPAIRALQISILIAICQGSMVTGFVRDLLRPIGRAPSRHRPDGQKAASTPLEPPDNGVERP